MAVRKRNEPDFLNAPLGDEYMGSKKPALKPESLDGADSAVLTIKHVEGVQLQDDDAEDGKRNAVRIDFEETDLPLWPNKTGLRALSEKYGPKPGDWIGEPCALVVVHVNNPSTKRQQKALHIAQGEEFDELVAENSKRTRRKPAKRARGK